MDIHNMNCVLCGHAEIKDSHTIIASEYGKPLLIIRNVPCYECEFCGEVMLNGEVADRVNEIADREKEHLKDEVTVVYYEPAT